jgi:hypothetical protein
MSHHDYWPEQEECDFDGPADDVIRMLCERNAPFLALEGANLEERAKDKGCALTAFRKELIYYHASFAPVRSADYILNIYI